MTQDIIEIFDVYSAKSVIGVSINEICTENNFYKAPDGTVCAWAEIYNASKYPADISGWGFSDDPKDPYKFSFPANVVLQSGERKIIFCDTAEHKDMQTAPLKFSEEENMLVLTNRFGKEMDRVNFGKIEA
ncbi:MAG: lamin tail domain-containing protein, partial [Ruminococcus sp.]|nr:lamin tail domain-containing protein [Ruminococcus sp.]